MRALILLECLVILALAALILLHPAPGQDTREIEVFPASLMLGDATPGETVAYRVDQATTLEFAVGAVDRGGPQGPPKITITRTVRDAVGAITPEPESTYVHQLVEHGLFPFLTPSAPKALDRTWVLRRIRRDEIRFLGRPLPCWRVECIDPALEPEQESVVVWMHEAVPVFGIVRFERAGHIYECSSWRPAS